MLLLNDASSYTYLHVKHIEHVQHKQLQSAPVLDAFASEANNRKIEIIFEAFTNRKDVLST